MSSVPTMKVKNYEEFQDYRKRGITSPEWIKLYRSLLTDYDGFLQLKDVQRSHLISIWLMAADMDNKIPYDRVWIKNRISATSPVNLDALIEAGFLVLEGEFQLSKGKKRKEETKKREKRPLGEVEKVWDQYILAWSTHYQEKNGKVGVEPSLTPVRRKMVTQALKAHGLEKVYDAILGLFMSAFHCGENEQGKEYVGIEYALRMNSKRDSVEHFATTVREAAAIHEHSGGVH